MIYLAIAVGGAIGGLLRLLLEDAFASVALVPLGTFLVNMAGSLILGVFYGIADARVVKVWVRLGLGTGVIGAFTTFSTFCMDTSNLLTLNPALAALYSLGSLMGGVFLVYIGDQLVLLVTRLVSETKGIYS